MYFEAILFVFHEEDQFLEKFAVLPKKFLDVAPVVFEFVLESFCFVFGVGSFIGCGDGHADEEKEGETEADRIDDD